VPTALIAAGALWADALPVKEDSLRYEILLTGKMLNKIHVDKKLTASLDITSNRLVLLSTADQFYALGWGGIVPLGKKLAGDICSYAYTSDSLLMTIRNNELCVFDSLGNLSRLIKLPNKGMGISAGKYVMYVYDRNKNQPKSTLYVIAKGGKYAKMFDVPAPITSVVEMNNSILFATENAVFSFNSKNKELKVLAALPKKKEIKSIAVDTSKQRVYFSTDSIVCALKDSSVVMITDKSGGILKYFNNGLIVFNPEKNLLTRMVGIETVIASAMETPAKGTQSPTGASIAPIPATPENVSPPVALPPTNTTNITMPVNPIPAGTTITAVTGSSAQTNPVDSAKPILTKQETSVPSANIQVKEILMEAVKTEGGNKLPIEESTFTINTISYVKLLKQLMTFYDSQFASLTGFVRKWDRRIRDSLDRERQIREILAQDEKALTDKKNATAGVFSGEIMGLKDKLLKDRDRYKRLKNDMVNDGKLLSDQLKDLGKATDDLINDKYNEVSRAVVKFHPDPSVGDTVNTMAVTKRKPDTNLINHVAPVIVVLACYENEIIPIRDTMAFWNGKALSLIHQDSKLAEQLEPLKKELLQYLSTPKDYQKLNKKQISDLKKQCNAINDDRELLAKQMVDDSKNLSECLDQMNKEVRGAVKDRFIDAAENIDRLYEMTPVNPIPSGTALAAQTIDESTFTISVLSYVKPLKQLMTFYDSQLVSLTGFVRKWDRRIRDSLDRERQMREILAQDEKALTDKKNATAGVFLSEIVSLKDKLSKDRDRYNLLENDMVNDGKLFSDQLKDLGKEADGLIDDKYSEVSRAVAKYHPDPSANDTVNTMTVTKQKLDTDLISHVFPVTVILACYENEIIPIRDTIALSNGKALALIQQDAKLAEQLEPLKNKLLQYQSAPKDYQKLNKQQISDLKKQCKAINNDRKQLAEQMADDSKKLSECLDQMNKEVRGAVKDRFIDAVENISRLYEDKF
jgi:gas vesicle protein